MSHSAPSPSDPTPPGCCPTREWTCPPGARARHLASLGGALLLALVLGAARPDAPAAARGADAAHSPPAAVAGAPALAPGGPDTGWALDRAPAGVRADLEALAVERAARPWEATYPACPPTVTVDGSTYRYECIAAAGHFFAAWIQAFATADAAQAAFEAARGGRPLTPFHGYPAAAWQYDERPGEPALPMRHRHHLWRGGRWLFGAEAFDDTAYVIAADPAEAAERLHEAALAVALLPPPPPTMTWDVQHLGDLGGVASAVAVSGDLAYLGIGQSLEVLDFADPAQPRRLSRQAMGGVAAAFAFAGHYLFAALGDDGLWSADIADPSRPGAGLSSGRPAWDLAVDGDRMVVAAGPGVGVEVFDARDPARPVPLAQLDTPGDARAVALVGPYALVADGAAGLRVLDLTDPRAPREVAALAIPALDVAVAGKQAYVTSGDDGLVVVDVTDPVAARVVGRLATAPNAAVHVAAAGTTAYVALRWGDVAVVDAGAPAAPVRRGTYHPSRAIQGCAGTLAGPGATGAARLVVAAGRAYVAAWDAGLRLVDVTRPATPGELATYAGPFPCAVDVQVAGERAFVAADLDGLRVVAATGEGDLGVVGALTGITATHLAVSGDYAYVSDAHSFWVVDLRDAQAPRLAGHIHPFDGWIMDFAVRNQRAYVAVGGQTGGLRVVDLSSPMRPRQVGSFTHPVPILAVALTGRNAYVVDGQGLGVLNVADPVRPMRIGWLGLPGFSALVATDSAQAYAGGAGMLDVVDVSEPSRPRLAGAHPVTGDRALAVADDRAYVAGALGIEIFDLNAPADPGALASSGQVQEAAAIAVDGDKLWVAEGPRGLERLWAGPVSRPPDHRTCYLPFAVRKRK